MKKTVSIIVPVFNVEKYIDECINSLLSQTHKDIEIILVDDESPDNCPKICDDYAMKDDRIKVLHKKNGGLSDARNAGIEIATGDYIMFVDSDDYITDDMVEQLLFVVDVSGMDIAACGYTGNMEDLNVGLCESIKSISSKKAIKCILKEQKINTSASTKLFKAQLFKNVRFPVGKIYEDYATIYKAIYNANGVAYINSKKYYYRPNPTGITGRGFYKKQLQYFEISNEVMSFVKENYPSYKRHVNNRATRMAISFCKNISKSKYDDLEDINYLISFIRNHIFSYSFSSYKFLSKAYGWFICFFPKKALHYFR